jgi:flagellar protein FliS
VEVKTANPVQLVVMLYDGAIAALKEAQEHVRSNNIAARSRCCNRATAIISELQATLNFGEGGRIAVSLDRLYAYMKQLIFRANFEKKCEPLAEAAGLLENLRPAWCAAATENGGAVPAVRSVAQAQARTDPQFTGFSVSG